MHADHVAGSRAKGHGAELLESADDALTEGIGLTSTDPAFFDAADLADSSSFGNGSGASRRIATCHAVCMMRRRQ
ncbi:hypothetical protein EOS93_06095 [Rhizobium sp. RMa-01]|nr:hypothetical protein EOS93_06095 [Rhizobium sp. RMa-01]